MEKLCPIDKKTCTIKCIAYDNDRASCHFVEAAKKVQDAANVLVNAGTLLISSEPKYIGKIPQPELKHIGKFPESAPPPEVKT